jgi:hypothetical protein
MDPSTLAPTDRKPSRWWILVTAVAGAAGALAAVGAVGRGTYQVGPFRIELRARPAALGTTELAIRAVEGFIPSHAEAGTHAAPMVFRATIVEVDAAGLVASDRAVARSPRALATFIGDDGKSAITAFAIRLALLALAGGAAAGLALSFGRWRRAIGAAVAGVLTITAIGILVQRTYNADEFLKTRYVFDRPPIATPGLPTS